MNNLITMHELSEVEKPVFKIPLKDGSEYTVKEVTLIAYKRAYPRLDVEDEIGRYIAWAISNESKRKTKRGILKSVNYWLSNQKPSQGAAATTQKEYAASTTIRERVTDLSWADGM